MERVSNLSKIMLLVRAPRKWWNRDLNAGCLASASTSVLSTPAFEALSSATAQAPCWALGMLPPPARGRRSALSKPPMQVSGAIVLSPCSSQQRTGKQGRHRPSLEWTLYLV